MNKKYINNCQLSFIKGDEETNNHSKININQII